MSTGGWLALFVMGGALLCVLVAPLFAALSLFRSAASRRGFRRFCRHFGGEVTRASGSIPLLHSKPATFASLYTGTEADQKQANGTLDAGRHSAEAGAVEFPKVKASSEGILALYAECDLPCSFALTKEDAFDAASKAAGLTREHHTGDGAFDREVFLSCEDIAFVRGYLTPERRRAAAALLRDGIQQVRYVSALKRLYLFSSPSYLRRFEPATSADLFENLAVLVCATSGETPEASPPFVQRRIAVTRARSTSWATLAELAALVACVYAAASARSCARQILSDEPVFNTTAAVSLAILAIALAWHLRRVRGTSTAHRTLARVWLSLLLFVPATTWTVLIFGNSLLDMSSTHEEPATFQGLRMWHQRSSLWVYTDRPAALLTIDRGELEPRKVEILISAERADSLQGKEGHPAYVVLRSGAFGFDYGVDFSVKP